MSSCKTQILSSGLDRVYEHVDPIAMRGQNGLLETLKLCGGAHGEPRSQPFADNFVPHALSERVILNEFMVHAQLFRTSISWLRSARLACPTTKKTHRALRWRTRSLHVRLQRSDQLARAPKGHR